MIAFVILSLLVLVKLQQSRTGRIVLVVCFVAGMAYVLRLDYVTSRHPLLSLHTARAAWHALGDAAHDAREAAKL